MKQDYSIGQLATLSDCSVQLIRHYESITLLPPPPRSHGNQRRYTDSHLHRLLFIRHSRDLGFSLDDIKELVGLTDRPEADCALADRIARRHLDAVDRRIGQLQALRSELARMIGECSHGRVADCRVIEALNDHAACSSDHPHAIKSLQ